MNHRSEQMAAVGLMAKHWTTGRVKTRLAASIGGQAAADLHRAMVAYMLRQLGGVSARRVLAVAPDNQATEFVSEAGWRWQITGQGNGDLGERIERLLRLLLSSGGNAVLVGSDCPHITAATIDQSLSQLEMHDAVMGPAADGGYYLIGLRGPWRELYDGLFTGVAWGTDAVAEQTRQSIAAAGLSVAELDLQHDIDRPADLPRLLQWLHRGGGDREFRSAVMAISAGWSDFRERCESAVANQTPAQPHVLDELVEADASIEENGVDR